MTVLNITTLQDLYKKVERHVPGENQRDHAKEGPHRKQREPKDIQHRPGYPWLL